MNMSSLSREEIMGLRRTFPLYVGFPEPRWPEIREAEADTDEGKRKLEELRKEFLATHMPGVPELYEAIKQPSVS